MCASDLTGWRWRVRAVLAGALLASLAGTAMAQQADREQEQLKRLKLQMRQLQQSHAELQETQARTEQARVQAEKSASQAQVELAGQRQAAGSASRKVSTLSRELDEARQERARLAEQVEQLGRQLQEGASVAARERAEWQAAQARQNAAQQTLTASLDQCRGQNAQLYLLGTDLLSRYEHKGIAEVLAQQEPFFQRARVRLENTRDELQDKLDAARLKPATPARATP